MKTMYRVRFGSIQSFQVISETEKKLTFIESGKENSEKKISTWYRWFETFEDAKQYLIEECEQKIKGLENNLLQAKKDLQKITEKTEIN